ncbi:MAG: hypothetical protein AAF719_03510 [Pseudomonadota bacterium]
MSEVVLKFDAADQSEAAKLTLALDAFAKWCDEALEAGDREQTPDFMMTTEHCGGQVRRKLIFQDRASAARFLVFWRSEKQRIAS